MSGTENNHPLLSICIPTYNRGYILKEVLQHYINNPEFDPDVELVISDNCSTDDTETICRKYVAKNPRIRYFRNEHNIHDLNFVKLLDRAKGTYLKLTNDWVYLDKESLAFVKQRVRLHANEKKPIFFTDDVIYTRRKAEVIECDNLDDYVASVSTFVTFNNIFGVWREHWEHLDEKSKYSSLKLQQVDWTYQIVVKFGGCVLYDKKVFTCTDAKRKVLTGYNWFEVHLDNYYKIMMPYFNDGLITKTTLKQDKHYLLNHFKEELSYTFFFNYSKVWKFDTKGTTRLLWKYYYNDLYFYFFMLKLPFYYLYQFIRRLFSKILRSL